ncbi:diguanylate cyclase [Lysobacter xanthus]
MSERLPKPAAEPRLPRWRAALVVPPACQGERDRVVRARVRALAPVIAALTAGWILLDGMALSLADVLPIALLRLLLAGALLALSRLPDRTSGAGMLRAFVWLQAIGFGVLQQVFVHDHIAALDIGYGLFPFAVAAQLALFPAPWTHVLRMAVAPAAMLTLAEMTNDRRFDVFAHNDVWLLALLIAVAAWTAHAQLQLLASLLGARREASQDALTGLANRRQADARLAAEHARCERHREPLSVLMGDLDLFKRINDRHGHAVGDLVLSATADAIAAELRASDLGARYGGEEFLVLLPEAAASDALAVAERIRARVAALRIEAGTAPIRVTISLGVAQLVPGESIESLLARADGALYRAKSEGRDRCVVDAAGIPA